MRKLLHTLQFIAAQILLTTILAISAPAIHMAQATEIFNSINTGGVSNGPSAPTVFSVSSSVKITNVSTYHWNGGSGSTPGTISLKHSDGTVYGPWTATGHPDPKYFKLYWNVYPDAVIKAGTYTVIDSGTATWSYNSASGNAGFVLVQGDVVTATPTTQATEIFNNINTSGVSNGPSAPTVFSVSSSVKITNVSTYHWNGGSGSTPGTISLKHSDGTVYGPWAATGTAAPYLNLYWNVSPETVIKPGSYTVIDSNTATWSYNSSSKYAGFASVKGEVVTTSTYAISTAASPTAGGSVTCSPNPVSSGSSSTCTATANSGYTFTGWSGDCSGTTSTCTLSSVSAQKSVTALFSVKSAAPSQVFDVVASASGDTSSLTLDLALNVNSADIGTQGSIYLGAQVPVSATKDAWFFHNSANWVNWTGSSIPAFFTGALPTSKNFAILRNGDARALANIKLYAGYGRNVDDMLNRNNVKLAYTIPSTSPSSSTSFSGNYIQGDMAGQSAFYTAMVDSLSLTTGALMQAVLAVNSFLYTDSSVTDYETFKLRQLEADAALSTLQRYAAETEAIIAGSSSSRRENNRAALSPEDVLATVASGPSNRQIKTLMTTYNVDAKKAQAILKTAMAGISAQAYNDEAGLNDTAARTATLVRDGSGLALTIAGASVAAGAAGTLGALDATTTLITGLDAAIKTTKSGLELVVGKDIEAPAGKMGALITGLSDASELIGIAGMAKWGEKAEKLANIYTIVSKTRDGLQEKVINIGAHTYDISAGDWTTTAWADLWEKNMPVTLPGTYKIAGVKTEVKELPKSITNVINRLPPADKVSGLTVYSVAASAGAGGKVSPTGATVNSGKTASFTVTPDTGYSIASVTGCGGTLSGNTYTTGAITANCTLSATFKAVTPTPTPTTSCTNPIPPTFPPDAYSAYCPFPNSPSNGCCYSWQPPGTLGVSTKAAR